MQGKGINDMVVMRSDSTRVHCAASTNQPWRFGNSGSVFGRLAPMMDGSARFIMVASVHRYQVLDFCFFFSPRFFVALMPRNVVARPRLAFGTHNVSPAAQSVFSPGDLIEVCSALNRALDSNKRACPGWMGLLCVGALILCISSCSAPAGLRRSYDDACAQLTDHFQRQGRGIVFSQYRDQDTGRQFGAGAVVVTVSPEQSKPVMVMEYNTPK